MLNVFRTVAAIGLMVIAGTAHAEPTHAASLNGDADLCFNEAQRAISGADPATLSTAPCRRALRHDPISRADRSAMLHNRGLIEQARGDLERAMVSHSSAVQLSTTIDIRNLALAQLAQKLGDLTLAIAQYDLLIQEGYSADDMDVQDRIQRNRHRAAEALLTAENVSRQ